MEKEAQQTKAEKQAEHMHVHCLVGFIYFTVGVASGAVEHFRFRRTPGQRMLNGCATVPHLIGKTAFNVQHLTFHLLPVTCCINKPITGSDFALA